MPNDKEHFVGIDVSKDWFDVAILGENTQGNLPIRKKEFETWLGG